MLGRNNFLAQAISSQKIKDSVAETLSAGVDSLAVTGSITSTAVAVSEMRIADEYSLTLDEEKNLIATNVETSYSEVIGRPAALIDSKIVYIQTRQKTIVPTIPAGSGALQNKLLNEVERVYPVQRSWGSVFILDTGGELFPYTNNEDYQITVDLAQWSNSANVYMEKFEFEHGAQEAYDVLTITTANDNSGTYEPVSVPWMHSSGSGEGYQQSTHGNIVPATTAIASALGMPGDRSFTVNNRFIRFRFKSDAASTRQGFRVIMRSFPEFVSCFSGVGIGHLAFAPERLHIGATYLLRMNTSVTGLKSNSSVTFVVGLGNSGIELVRHALSPIINNELVYEIHFTVIENGVITSMSSINNTDIITREVTLNIASFLGDLKMTVQLLEATAIKIHSLNIFKLY